MAMILKAWNWYQNSLSVHPVRTQVATSGVLWAVGDITAQYITHTAAAKKQLSLTVVSVYVTIAFLILLPFFFVATLILL